MPGVCDGRVALVTGASRGIGRAIAHRLASEGAAVAICSRPAPGAAPLGTLDEAAAELRAFDVPVLAMPFDVADPSADRTELVTAAESALGPVDILVNNAAAGGYRSFLEWTDAQIDHLIEANVRRAVAACAGCAAGHDRARTGLDRERVVTSRGDSARPAVRAVAPRPTRDRVRRDQSVPQPLDRHPRG